MKKSMKKVIKAALTFAVVVTAFASNMSFNQKNEVSAANDHTTTVKVTNWNFLDGSGNPLSATNTAKFNTGYQLSAEWELHTDSGEVLHEGDTFGMSLPYNVTGGYWGVVESAWVNFTDSKGVVLGKWRIASSYIEVVLGANSEGVTSITGAKFVSGKNAFKCNNSVEIVQDVVFGGIAKQIGFSRVTLSPLGTNDVLGISNTSNSVIGWYASINNAGPNELYLSERGSKFTVKKDVYYEDTLEGKVKDNVVGFAAPITHPVDLETGVPANANFAFSTSNLYTKVAQNSGESYDAFKARLKPFEYGIYSDKAGVQTVVAFIGDIGANGLTYSEVYPEFAEISATQMINRGVYTEDEREELIKYYNDVYGEKNVIGGEVARYQISYYEEFDKVIFDTPKQNDIKLTMNGQTTVLSNTATLQGNLGSAVVNQTQAGVVLYDADTNEVLSGATFKLQIKNASTGAWQDYASQPELTTNADGFAQTNVLAMGTYRFVETAAVSAEYDLPNSEGYDSSLDTVISNEFVVASVDAAGQVIPVSNLKYRFTVTYAPGEGGDFTNDVHEKILINSNTPAFEGSVDAEGTPLAKEGYVFTGWDLEISETVTEDATYTAMWREIPVEPEITEPEVTEPEVTEPEVTEPEVTEPEVKEPETTTPEVTPDVDGSTDAGDNTAELAQTGFSYMLMLIMAFVALLFTGIKFKGAKLK